MPAVTYHAALKTMMDDGDEVLQYIEDAIGDLERTVVVVDGMLKEREATQPKAANS
jgi:hypothetical protein